MLRLRHAAAAVFVLATLGYSSVAAEGDTPVRGGLGGGDDEVVIEGSTGPAPTPSHVRPSTPVTGPPGPPAPPPPPLAFEPMWAEDPETGAPCIELEGRPGVDVSGTMQAEWEARLLQMLQDPRLADVGGRFCDAEAAAPVLDPTVAAREFVRSIPIPEPTPEIAPGIAVTGLPSYLVIANQDGFTVTETLAGFGAMEVTLEPVAFDVDWGDGTTVRVDDGRTGVSWEQSQSDPAAAISHTYISRDLETVVTVEADWLATWSVGGFSGVVSGLSTDTSFVLPVQEYRAVRLTP
jgi:hypothetical protein